MPDDKLSGVKDQRPTYVFKGRSPAEDYLEIARIHHREAKQLLEGAEQAKTEERPEEYSLLRHLWDEREKTAIEFEGAAKGENTDPIVTQILDSLEENREPWRPYAPEFLSEEQLIPKVVPVVQDLSLKGRLVSAVAWIGSLIAH